MPGTQCIEVVVVVFGSQNKFNIYVELIKVTFKFQKRKTSSVGLTLI